MSSFLPTRDANEVTQIPRSRFTGRMQRNIPSDVCNTIGMSPRPPGALLWASDCLRSRWTLASLQKSPALLLARLASGALPAVVLNSIHVHGCRSCGRAFRRRYLGCKLCDSPPTCSSAAGRQDRVGVSTALVVVSAAETPKTPSMITRETPCHTTIDHISPADYGSTSGRALNCSHGWRFRARRAWLSSW